VTSTGSSRDAQGFPCNSSDMRRTTHWFHIWRTVGPVLLFVSHSLFRFPASIYLVIRFQRLLTMVHGTRDYWGSGLVHRPVSYRTRSFEHGICFRPQVRGWETPTLCDQLEIANIKHWTTYMNITAANHRHRLVVQCFGLALPSGPNRVGVPHALTRGRKKIQFPKRRVF
jgi:hypothetical protein